MAYTSPSFKTSNNFIKYRIVVTETAQSIPNNRTTANVKVQAWRTNTGYTTDGSGTCYCNIGGVNFSNSWSSGQKPITHNSYTTLLDQNVAINHNADGTRTIYISAYIRHSQFTSNSQGFNVTLTQIPRAATFVVAPNFNDIDNPVITYSNPAGELVDSVEACIALSDTTPVVSPTVAYRTLNSLGSTYTFELTQAEREALLAASPDSNTLVIYYILKTTIQGTDYYSTAIATMSVVEANPTITGASYEDTNSATTAITGDDTKIIQNNSIVSFNFTSLAALKGSSLSSIAVTIDGVTVSSSLSGSTASNVTLAFGVINSSNDVAATVTLTDSRGNVSTTSLTVTMLEWSLPTGTISLKRRSNYYSETDITVTANYSSLDGNNAVTITYEYKETSASTWSAPATLTDGVTTTITLDNTKSYDFRFTVADLIGSTIYNKALQVGIPILFIDRVKRAVGIGTLPKWDNMLAVDRRISLFNTLQEHVADLWSTDISDVLRSAHLLFFDKDDKERVRLSGYNGGFLQFTKTDGTRNAYYGADGLYIYNSSNQVIGSIAPYSDKGFIYVADANGDVKAQFWVGGNGDGVVDVKDAQGNTTVTFSGDSGEVSCKRVRSSESVVEVVDTSFSSGNKTFNDDDYNTITVIAKVTSTSSYNIINIPVMFLSSSNKKFCISDEVNYVTFNLKLDNGVYTITWDSANSSGSIQKVYAHY